MVAVVHSPPAGWCTSRRSAPIGHEFLASIAGVSLGIAFFPSNLARILLAAVNACMHAQWPRRKKQCTGRKETPLSVPKKHRDDDTSPAAVARGGRASSELILYLV